MRFKKIKLLLMFLLALLLANTVSAALNDLNLLYQTSDTQDSMVWPMLPDESLAELAAKFYPHSKAMQRKFISKTKRLNTTKLSASTRYKKVTAITIPNLDSLPAQAGVIKRAKKKKSMRLSYNIEPEEAKSTFSIASIPERLIRQYEELLVRNEFLKVELDKLNNRLIFLEDKLGQLSLILDKTLSLPSTKKLKNLDTPQAVDSVTQAKPAKKPVAVPTKKQAATKKPTTKSAEHKNAGGKSKVQQKHYLDFSNKLLWLGLALFGLFIVLGSYLISKYREKKYTNLVRAISQQNPVATFSAVDKDISPAKDALLDVTTRGPNTVLEEHNDQSVLEEAKAMVKKGVPDEAIGHLKWAIRAKPKTAINAWLYLLALLRKQNLKDEFEKFALEMHQNFNVMTPLWEQREVAMIVPQSLEEFPYIIKLLTEKWPNKKIANYLNKLISDNRSGERTGFSQAVVEEVILLVGVLEVRREDEQL